MSALIVPPMHVTRRVIEAKKIVGADPCVCPEMPLSKHISKRVTTGGYPYIRGLKV